MAFDLKHGELIWSGHGALVKGHLRHRLGAPRRLGSPRNEKPANAFELRWTTVSLCAIAIGRRHVSLPRRFHNRGLVALKSIVDTQDEGETAAAALLFIEAVKMDQKFGSVPFWMANLLDRFAEVRIDDKSEDEYWFLQGISCMDSYKVLRKDTSLVEIAIGGLAAGMVVEFVVALLCHPFDTVKTRLQADPKAALKRYPTFAGLYDGFRPVVLTVPLLSVFWATRDAVRTSIIGVVDQNLPWPVLNVLASGIGAFMGESVYWLIKAPGQILKTQEQVGQFAAPQKFDLSEILKAWPVLALVDVPYVALRVTIFSSLHESGLVPHGLGEDALLYTVANVLAVMITTPLDVLRTQILLRGGSLNEMPDVAKDLYSKSGVLAFIAGWSPRLLYNGILVGMIWGVVRQSYDDVRAKFLLEILDQIEKGISFDFDILKTATFSFPLLQLVNF